MGEPVRATAACAPPDGVFSTVNALLARFAATASVSSKAITSESPFTVAPVTAGAVVSGSLARIVTAVVAGDTVTPLPLASDSVDCEVLVAFGRRVVHDGDRVRPGGVADAELDGLVGDAPVVGSRPRSRRRCSLAA